VGANLTRRLMRRGHEVVVFDVSPDAVALLEREGATPSSSLEELMGVLAVPSCISASPPGGSRRPSIIRSVGRARATRQPYTTRRFASVRPEGRCTGDAVTAPARGGLGSEKADRSTRCEERMDPKEIFELIIKADEKLKYAKDDNRDTRESRARALLEQALAAAREIGNDALVQQAETRLADLDTAR
jgi:hypothetical protein